ncbi:MAG: polysaccharide pyruvyl transferase family protein [Acutalibacteraceae bacterium]
MRILMRAQMEHDKVFTPEQVLLGNLMGGNSGNWLYQYSLYRALLTDETVQIDIINVAQSISKKYADYVNETYDMFILPLANAFKNSFAWELRELTTFIKRLKIPCIVIGVGIQIKNLGAKFIDHYSDTEAAKEFVKAVLDKSSMIGVRGESTAEFFSDMGFQAEKDFTVIGCPSMYMYGSKLPQTKPFTYSDSGLYLYTSKVEHENKKIVTMFDSFVKEHPNYKYAPQRLRDMILYYYGREYVSKGADENRFFKPENVVVFTSVPQWINYLNSNIDLSIGTRLHGNIISVLSGVPSLIIATDQRVNELAEYHNIPHTTIGDVSDNATIQSLVENTDFNSVHQGHEERFNHFVDFLEKNGIKNAYSENRNVENVYFDSIIKNLDFSYSPLSFAAETNEEKINRSQQAAVYFANCWLDTKAELKKQQTDATKLRKKLSQLKNTVVNTSAASTPSQTESETEQEEKKGGFFSKLFK